MCRVKRCCGIRVSTELQAPLHLAVEILVWPACHGRVAQKTNAYDRMGFLPEPFA